MKKPTLYLALIGACFTSGAYAQTTPAVSVSAGTTGIGLHLVMPYNAKTNFRVGFNGYDYSGTGTTEDATYTVSAKLRTVDALLDYFPSAGAFRLTGGLIYNGNKGDLIARPRGGTSYTFNGTTYSVSAVGDIHGDVEFNKIAPYLGIGYGNAARKDGGWSFAADLGVMFQGTPEVTLRSSDCRAGTDTCSQLATDLAAENAEWREKAEDYRFYPVLRVGLAYKF